VVLVPEEVVTVMSTVPGASPDGAVAVMEVEELTVKLAAGIEPKVTAVAPVKLVPVTETEVPPAVEPELGLTPVTVGPEPLQALKSAPSDEEMPAGDWEAVGDTAPETLGL